MEYRLVTASALAFISGVGLTYLLLEPTSPQRARQEPAAALLSDAEFGNSPTNFPAGMPSTKRVQKSDGLDANRPGTQRLGPRSDPSRISEQPRFRPARSRYSEGKTTDQTREQRRASKQLDRLMEAVASYTKQKTESAPSYDTRSIEAQTRWSQLKNEDRQFLIAEGLQEYDQANEGEVHE